MKLRELVDKLHLSVRSGEDQLDREVTGGYAGDLLSDVMANSRAGNVWVTMQPHINIVAVSVLKEHAGIILVQGKEPLEETLARAAREHVAILVSDLPAFETSGRVYALVYGST